VFQCWETTTLPASGVFGSPPSRPSTPEKKEGKGGEKGAKEKRRGGGGGGGSYIAQKSRNSNAVVWVLQMVGDNRGMIDSCTHTKQVKECLV